MRPPVRVFGTDEADREEASEVGEVLRVRFGGGGGEPLVEAALRFKGIWRLALVSDWYTRSIEWCEGTITR